MTNAEYEKLSITAANPEELKAWYDAEIAAAEAKLANLEAGRREVINRYNLNKCTHKHLDLSNPCRDICLVCGEVISW